MMPATAADPQPRHLTINVIDGDTGDPVPGAEVTLYRWATDQWVAAAPVLTTGSPGGSVVTDFSYAEPVDLTLGFTDPSGVYQPGFGTDVRLTQLPAGPTDPGTFHYGTDFADLTLTGILTAAPRHASGLATAASGAPIANPRVTVYQWNPTEGGFWDQWGSVSTGEADGSFNVSVPPLSRVTFEIARTGFQTVFLGGGAVRPATPDDSNSRLVRGADLDLGTFALQPRATDLGRVAGQVLPYCTANTLAANDDSSTTAIDIPFPLTFFGTPYTQLYVNNNGNVTFNSRLGQYTPSSLVGDTGRPIIAPFFADVDTRGLGSAEVTYGSSPDGQVFCVNWADVGYFGSHADKVNTFQLLLTANSTGEGRTAGDFDITFNYDRILWETGDASSGSNGFGGTSAAVGFSAGTGVDGTFVQLPGSFVNGALLDGGPNALVSGFQGTITPGRYVFQVRNSGIAETLGGLHGTVLDTNGARVAGAFVQACRGTGNYCRPTATNDQGDYAFTGLPVGNYGLTVSPPPGSDLFPGAGSSAVVAGTDTLVPNIVLQAPRPMPSGVTLTNADPDSPFIDPYVPPSGPPVVHYMADLQFAFDGCPAVAGATVTETVGGVVVATVSLTESPAGHYSAVIPRSYPAHGEGSLVTNVPLTCDGAPVGFDIYIDPSGVVTDQYGRPLEGATVELRRADAGTGPFTAVPDGSAVMSPSNRTNPDTTDAAGFFRWDVLAGWY
ncbi:MAG TPA: nidogen-like domain-containing protein, partial [Nocardioides sp.]|nr:nidogen-like domain-containing protein [Nocardioides sp.]